MHRLRRPVACAVAVAGGLGTAVSPAQAVDILGVWSFDGGQVTVVRQPNGTDTGFVVRETTLGACTHADGSPFLRVCFAVPERPDLQPQIGVDGSSTGTSVPCQDAEKVSPIPARPTEIQTLATVPRQGRRNCLARPSFSFRLRALPGDAIAFANVFVGGRRTRTLTGPTLGATVRVTGRRRGAYYTLRLTVRTVIGRTISAQRRYRTCARARARDRRRP